MATNTSGGTTTSFSNTPQAQDDVITNTGLTEDLLGIRYLDVMANDLGGNAKMLWSLDNGISVSTDTRIYAPVDLLAQDTARAELVSTDTSLNGAKIWITSDGKVGYDAACLTAAFKAQLQALAAGETLNDSFTYAIRLGNGTLSWATAQVQFGGVNDGPVAVADVNAVTEDTGSPVSGNLLTNDTDGDTHDTHSVDAVNGVGAHVGHDVDRIHGTLHLDSNGNYT